MSGFFEDCRTGFDLDVVRLLPDWCKVRLGPDNSLVIFVESPNGDIKHVDVRLDQAELDGSCETDLDSIERLWKPMVNNLAGAILFDEFGEEMIKIHRKQALAVTGQYELTKDDLKLLARRSELSWNPPVPVGD